MILRSTCVPLGNHFRSISSGRHLLYNGNRLCKNLTRDLPSSTAIFSALMTVSKGLQTCFSQQAIASGYHSIYS